MGSTRGTRRRLYQEQDGLCHYCERLMVLTVGHHPLAVTVDHKLPRSKGGTRSPDNVVGACWQCNGVRGDLPYEEFKAVWRYLHARGLPEPKSNPQTQRRNKKRSERRKRYKARDRLPSAPANVIPLEGAKLAEFWPRAV